MGSQFQWWIGDSKKVPLFILKMLFHRLVSVIFLKDRKGLSKKKMDAETFYWSKWRNKICCVPVCHLAYKAFRVGANTKSRKITVYCRYPNFVAGVGCSSISKSCSFSRVSTFDRNSGRFDSSKCLMLLYMVTSQTVWQFPATQSCCSPGPLVDCPPRTPVQWAPRTTVDWAARTVVDWWVPRVLVTWRTPLDAASRAWLDGALQARSYWSWRESSFAEWLDLSL